MQIDRMTKSLNNERGDTMADIKNDTMTLEKKEPPLGQFYGSRVQQIDGNVEGTTDKSTFIEHAENAEETKQNSVHEGRQYATKRHAMMDSEAQILMKIIEYCRTNGGRPILLSKVKEIMDIPDAHLKHVMMTSMIAERLIKVQSDPEPGFIVTIKGREVLMQYLSSQSQAGTDKIREAPHK
jgi:hypothetical protein